MKKWENEQERFWREQDLARQAMEYCQRYLVEYINNNSTPSRLARSLGRFSTNDADIIDTVMSALADIRPLEDEFDIKNFSFVVHNVLMSLHDLERFETKQKLLTRLKAAGYVK
jgi:hypothetical protein